MCSHCVATILQCVLGVFLVFCSVFTLCCYYFTLCSRCVPDILQCVHIVLLLFYSVFLVCCYSFSVCSYYFKVCSHCVATILQHIPDILQCVPCMLLIFCSVLRAVCFTYCTVYSLCVSSMLQCVVGVRTALSVVDVTTPSYCWQFTLHCLYISPLVWCIKHLLSLTSGHLPILRVSDTSWCVTVRPSVAWCSAGHVCHQTRSFPVVAHLHTPTPYLCVYLL